MLNLHLVGVSSVYSILCYVRCLAAGFTTWNEHVVVFVGPDTTYVVGVVLLYTYRFNFASSSPEKGTFLNPLSSLGVL